MIIKAKSMASKSHALFLTKTIVIYGNEEQKTFLIIHRAEGGLTGVSFRQSLRY